MSPDREWYRYRFCVAVDWERNKVKGLCPEWWVDLFLFDKVVRSILDKHHEKQMDFWRIHRRAEDDGSGHICSLMCMVTKSVAEKIDKAIRTNKFFRLFKKSPLFVDYSYRREDLNDGEWPPSLLIAWPVYAQGISEFFLTYLAGLCEKERKGLLGGEIVVPFTILSETDAMYGYYKSYGVVQSFIKGQWYGYGCHSLFHHLSGIFGYAPLHCSVDLRGITGVF